MPCFSDPAAVRPVAGPLCCRMLLSFRRPLEPEPEPGSESEPESEAPPHQNPLLATPSTCDLFRSTLSARRSYPPCPSGAVPADDHHTHGMDESLIVLRPVPHFCQVPRPRPRLIWSHSSALLKSRSDSRFRRLSWSQLHTLDRQLLNDIELEQRRSLSLLFFSFWAQLSFAVPFDGYRFRVTLSSRLINGGGALEPTRTTSDPPSLWSLTFGEEQGEC